MRRATLEPDVLATPWPEPTAERRAGSDRVGVLRVVGSRLSTLGLPALGAGVVVALWWLATIVFQIQPFFLPAPPDIVRSFLAEPRFLLDQAGATLTETLIGFGIAIVTGLFIAVALTSSRILQRMTLPLLIGVNSIPKLALAPLLLLWMGYGQAPRVVMVVLISFFPIVVAAMTGLMSTPGELGELASSLSANRWQMLVKVRFPWALPQMFIGLKVGVSLAVIGAVVSEFSASNEGLGFVIIQSGLSANTAMAFAAITLLSLMSISLFYIVVAVERLLLPWSRETTTG